jgi:hypothetical protein
MVQKLVPTNVDQCAGAGARRGEGAGAGAGVGGAGCPGGVRAGAREVGVGSVECWVLGAFF